MSDVHYDETVITFLGAMWGEGFLSPGGPEEVARLVDGRDLTGKTVVDIGSGAGGVTMALVRNHNAAKVIGLDVEEPVCTQARKLIEKAGLSDRIEIRQVEPGPMPLDDGSVDVVFSKDSIVHIADKESLAADAFRVLKPGGEVIMSDWLIAHDDEPSPEMAAYIAAEDLDFGMASPARYAKALEAAGFTDIELVNRNAWYKEVAKEELARFEGAGRAAFVEVVGEEETDNQRETWRLMVPVLQTGEHCPHHIRAKKPA